MAIQLYKKGNTHVINGIVCTMKTVDEYSFESMLSAGWYLIPEQIPKGKTEISTAEPAPEPEPEPQEETKPIKKKKGRPPKKAQKTI